jgi:hypothetical protein
MTLGILLMILGMLSFITIEYAGTATSEYTDHIRLVNTWKGSGFFLGMMIGFLLWKCGIESE